jgi:hypothetical protein
MADSKGKEKDAEDKKDAKVEVSAKVARIVREDEPALQLFVAHDPKHESHPAEWIVDSGASVHMSCRHDWFRGFRVLVPTQRVVIGDGRSIEATGIGSIELELKVQKGKTRRTMLQQVYFVPNLYGNLLSVPCLTKKGYETSFSQDACAITQNGSIAALARKRESLYILTGRTCTSEGTRDTKDPSSWSSIEAPLMALTASAHISKCAGAEIGNSSGRCRVIESRDVVFKENNDRGPSHPNIRVEDTETKPYEKGKQTIEAKDSPVNQKSIAIHVKETLHEDEGDLEDFLRDVPSRELRRSSRARKAPTRDNDVNYFLDEKDLPRKLETRHVELVAGGPDADLWPRWKKDVNGEPMKVKKKKLTFGTIESGATSGLWRRDYTAVERGISSSGSTINNENKIRDLPDSVGALINDQHSEMGRVLLTGGGAVSWQLKKQESVALLDSEAEYTATASASKEVPRTSALLTKLKSLQDQENPLPTATRSLSKSVISPSTRKVDTGQGELKYVPTNGDVYETTGTEEDE